MIRDQETIKQLVDLIERFVRERLVPNEERLASEGRLPDDILEEMKALGLFGLTIPEEYGGLGLTMEEEILVSIALGRTPPLFAPSWEPTTASAPQRWYLTGQKNKSRSTCQDTPPAIGSPAFASRNRKPVLMPPR